MMQRYNSMLSSSIILIFSSELIIHTDNLMIFLEDSRRVEAMYVLFSYLIWKMPTKHPYSLPWMQQTPDISFSWKKWIVSFSDQHKLQQLEGTAKREQCWVAVWLFWAVLRCGCPLECPALFPQLSAGAAALGVLGQWSCTAAAPVLCTWLQPTHGFNRCFYFMANGNFGNQLFSF